MDKPWTRSSDGIVLGVCRGLAERFQVDVMVVRIVCILTLCIGSFLLYPILALSFPKPQNIGKAAQPKVFGVCLRFSRRFDIDLGLVRAAALLSLFVSGGTTLLVYFALYFILPTLEEIK